MNQAKLSRINISLVPGYSNLILKWVGRMESLMVFPHDAFDDCSCAGRVLSQHLKRTTEMRLILSVGGRESGRVSFRSAVVRAVDNSRLAVDHRRVAVICDLCRRDHCHRQNPKIEAGRPSVSGRTRAIG